MFMLVFRWLERFGGGRINSAGEPSVGVDQKTRIRRKEAHLHGGRRLGRHVEFYVQYTEVRQRIQIFEIGIRSP